MYITSPFAAFSKASGKAKKIFDFPVYEEANRHRLGNSYGTPFGLHPAL